jgi:Uma2 family endonuclease
MAAVSMIARDTPFTRDELDAMPNDGNRHELLDGQLLVTRSPRFIHQSVVAGLYLLLHRECPPELQVLFAPFDVVLANDTVLIPDLLVAERSSFTERDLPGAPLLAVEVLSPSTKSFDRVLKRERYQRAGCPSYWIVDPDQPSLLALELAGGEYRPVTHVSGDDSWTALRPFQVTLVPNELPT